MVETSNKPVWLIAGAFVVLAAATRFYRLDWSFSGDALSTVGEVRSLLEKPFFMREPGYLDQQPRAQPVGYLLQAATYALFGTGEAGSRVGAALAGTASIGLAVFLACRLYGSALGVIVGTMLVLWPWHLGHSQSARVHIYAFLFGSTALLAMAMALRRRSWTWGALSGVATAAAISSHLMAFLIVVGFVAFFAAEKWIKRGPDLAAPAVGYVAVGGPFIAVSCLLGWLAMRQWPAEAGWGSGTWTAVVPPLAFNLTWGVALMSSVGWLRAWSTDDPTSRLWACISAVGLAACFVLPYFVAFRHDYVFSSSLAYVLLAAAVLAHIWEVLRTGWPRLRVAAMAACVLLPLPSFVSYYQDGDRPDFRAAARCVKQHMQPGDLVASNNPASMGHYLGVEVLPAPRGQLDRVVELANGGKRLWLVWHWARDEYAPELDQWLYRNAVRIKRIKAKRFDYHENKVDVFLVNPEAGRPTPRPDEGRPGGGPLP